jgi:hypothetical protein
VGSRWSEVADEVTPRTQEEDERARSLAEVAARALASGRDARPVADEHAPAHHGGRPDEDPPQAGPGAVLSSSRVDAGRHDVERATTPAGAVKDSPGIPPGQAAGERPVAARDAEEEKEPVTSPARVSEGGRVLAEEAWSAPDEAREAFDALRVVLGPPSTWLHANAITVVADSACPPDRAFMVTGDGRGCALRLHPGASEPEPTDDEEPDTRPRCDACDEVLDYDEVDVGVTVVRGYYCPSGCKSAPAPETFAGSEPDGEAPSLTDAQVEQALREAGMLGLSVDDARAERVRARLFGKDGGT